MRHAKLKLLVLGGRGFLGSNLGQYLKLGRDLQVKSASNSGLSGVSARNGSPQSFYFPIIDDWKPHVIVNCVALVGHSLCDENPELALAVNSHFIDQLAAKASKSQTKLIHFSTDAVFSGLNNPLSKYDENDTPEPFSNYGSSKLLGEHAALAASNQNLVLRTNFFGWSPTGEQGVLEYFLRGVSRQETTIGYGNYVVTSGFVGDIATSLVEILARDLGGLFHLTSEDSMSKYEFGANAARVFGFNKALLVDRPPSAWATSGVKQRDLSLSNQKLLGLGVTVPSQVMGIENSRREMRNMIANGALPPTDWRRTLC